MATTSTANMSLPVPVVGVELGPQYAIDINTCMDLIDSHDHSSGQGVKISQAGINISGDLELNSNNLTEIRTNRFDSQSAVLSLPTDLRCAYVVSDDLYFNDGLGNQIRITQSGGVAGTPGSISGLVAPASATYIPASSKFVWQSAVNVAATMDMGSIIIRPLSLSANGVTIAAPVALASNYTMTLPTGLPASSLPMLLDNTGQQSTGLITPTLMSSAGATGGKFLQSQGSNGQSYVHLPGRNYAQNAEFRFWQRQDPTTLTNRQDDAFGPDRMYLLNSGGAVNMQCARVSSSDTTYNTLYAGQFRQGDATPRQFGVAQMLEANDVIGLRGKTVTFSFVAKTDSTEITALRCGVVEWTGTADSVTSDIVSSWAATPTLIANAAFINTPADLTVSSSFAQFSVTVTLGTTFNNLLWFIWTPNTEAQNDDFYLKQVQLVNGSFAMDWNTIAQTYPADLLQCQRFYEKSYNVDVNLNTVTNAGIFESRWTTSSNPIFPVKFGVTKFRTPTCTAYNPNDGSANEWYEAGPGTNAAKATTQSQAGMAACSFSVATLTTTTDIVRGHWSAEAEM